MYQLPRIAFWLVPEVSLRKKIQVLITALARRFDTVPFVPHVTLYSSHRTTDQQEVSIIGRLAKTAGEVIVEVNGLSGSDGLTRALFVDLGQNTRIDMLYDELHAGVHRPTPFINQPHLSLLYQFLTPHQRDELIKEITLNFTEIPLTELWAVAIPEHIVSVNDLVGWQPLLTCRLAS